MKILYLSQYFPPEMGAPAARVHELSREWAALGHEVTVLTGFPHHPTGVVPKDYRGELIRREIVDGIRVVRAPVYTTPNRGRVRRSLSYASFATSATLLGPLLTQRPDVLIATSPQFLTGVAGLAVSALRRTPFVFEVRDLWPRSIVEVGALAKDSALVRLLERIERTLYARADHIVVVTESSVDELAALKVPREKISVVKNGVDLNLFQPRPRAEARRALGLPDGFIASYVGTHGLAHGLGTLLDAAKLAPTLHFILAGEGAEKAQLKARAAHEGLRNVTFLDQRPRTEVAQLLAASDVCLVMLKDAPLFRTVIPSKIFECMGAGRAIVTTVDGESRRILEDAGAGIFTPPGDARALATLLGQLANQPDRLEALGQSGRAHAVAHDSRPALARRYLALLEQVAARGKR